MKIKNRLYMSAGFSIILVVILFSVVLVTSGRIAEEDRKHQLLTNVSGGIAELDIVTYEYLLHREKRMEQQWYSKFNSLREILEKGAAEEGLIPLYDDYVALGNLFSQITTNDKTRQKLIQEGASQTKIYAATGLGERLVAQILIASQSIFTDASRLAEEAHAGVTEAQRLASNLTLILMTILAITVTTLLLLVARSISKPLDELTKGAEIIGKGDLKHRVGVKSKDELGELAAAFNKMTANLREITASRDELNKEIAERKRAEEELWKSEEKYRTLVEGLEDVIVRFALDGTILYCSPNVSNFGGYDSKEEIGQHFTKYIADEEAKQELQEFFQGIIKRKKTITFGFRYMPKSKDPFYVEAKANPIINEKTDEIVSIQCIVRDITERKKAEEKIKAQKKFTDNVIDSLRDTFYIFDPESGKGIQWNKTLNEISGYDYKKMSEYPPLHFYPPEEHQLIEEAVETTLEKGHALVEVNYIIADGTRIPFEYSLTRIKDAEGKTRICVIGRDVTKRKEMEEKLVRSEKLAVLGQLAGGVGHELRNPLGAIKNAAYFLNMALEQPEPEVKETLDILEREVATSERIISSLLGFARPKPPIRRKVDINEVIQEALYHVTVPENVKVVTQPDKSLPAILADPDQLGQVFTNVTVNAIQAMPEGGQLAIKSEASNQKWVTISFADTGAGIPKENLQKLFEPLFTTKAKGIGLGLAVTKTLVEGHGGTIKAQSAVGKGSTFTVRLPIGGGEEK